MFAFVFLFNDYFDLLKYNMLIIPFLNYSLIGPDQKVAADAWLNVVVHGGSLYFR
jgi:hypothetical protein